MNTGHVRAAALAAAVIMMLAGCAAAHRDAGLAALTKPGDRNVTVAAIPSADLAGLYIAQDDGLFARQGLHVTIKTIASTKAVIASQLNGQVDIGAGGMSPTSKRKPRAPGSAFSPRPPPCGRTRRVLLTTAGSRITTLAGLAGKKIAVNGTNSIGTLLISALLAENGIRRPRCASSPTSRASPIWRDSSSGGSADAAFLAEPYASKAEEDYGQVELADLDQGAALNFPIGGYVATQAWARQHPRTAAAFVRAIEEGQALAENNPSTARAAMGKSDHLPPRGDRGHVAARLPRRPGEWRAHAAHRRRHAPVRRPCPAVRRRSPAGHPDKVDDLPQLSRRLSHPPAASASAADGALGVM